MSSPASAQRLLSAADCAPGSALYGEIVEFLYREAELLDENRFGEWLDLFTEDTHYVMPVRTTQFRAKGDGFQEVAFFEENYVSLRTRVKRLDTNFAWAETPPSRTRHFISNILAEPAEKPGEIAVRSSFFVTRTRSDQGYQFFTGQRRDLLRRAESGDLKIADRRILIDQTTLSGSNLSIFF
jgi:3-phenylpropionate/cinnamic acid dioxygenase small subunit